VYDDSNSQIQQPNRDRNPRDIKNIDLLREFDTSKCHIAEDWNEWLKKTSHQLLKQNPSPVLYSCSTLTEVYAPLATELYNIAFVSCWRFLKDEEKRHIMNNFSLAIKSHSRTTQVLQTILNLAEFMELDENGDIKLFSAKTLAKIAENCNAYAKALYYWEQEFDNNPRDTIELLI
jgi:FKBP12-rapamycin complex-associated protein